MSLLEHARRETAIYFDHSNDDYDGELKQGILDIVEHFASQGHSGFSEAFAKEMLMTLLDYLPLTPLRGTEDEWSPIDVNDYTDEDQNIRCSRVFRDRKTGVCFDIEGYMELRTNLDGSTFMAYARRDIEFPYKPQHIMRPEPGNTP
jgi:hypothetical protein